VTDAGGSSALVDEALTSAVLDVVGRYATQAMAVPMTGRAPQLDDLMTDAARASLGTPDGALTDEGIAVVTATPDVTVSAELAALAVGDPPVSVVVATIDAASRGATSAGATVSVHRRGDLTLVLEAGAWKIDSYHLNVERKSP
jgi:hypothetical protein